MTAESAHYFSQVQQNDGWRAILESFARFINLDQGSRVLDIGCGPAALVVMLQPTVNGQAYGVDADPAMLTAAADLHGRAIAGKLSIGKLPHLPYPTASFDMVTATNVFYLLAEPLPAIQEAARLLKRGGQLCMLNPSEQMSIASATALADERGLTGFARQNFLYWGEVAENNYRWTETDVRDLFTQAGLRLLETRLRVGDGLARYVRAVKED